MSKWLLVFPAVLLVCAMIAPVDQVEAAPNTVSLGAASGEGDDGKPREPTEVTGTVGSAHKLCWTFRNDTGQPLTDIHVEHVTRVTGVPAKITRIDTWEGDDDTSHMTGSPSGDGLSASARTEDGETLGKGKEMLVCIKLTDLGDNDLPDGAEVRYKFYGTMGADDEDPDGQMVSNTSATGIGNDVPRTALTSLGIPDFSPGPAQFNVWPSNPNPGELNDFCLAETCDYRFETGSLVITPNNSTRFVIDEDSTQVLVYTENGDVAGGDMAVVENLRLNRRGALVFDVMRNIEDSEHIVLVIRGLRLEGLNHGGGEEIHATATGTAIDGACLKNMWKIAHIGS